jgi:SAM-dependent methyltransferase
MPDSTAERILDVPILGRIAGGPLLRVNLWVWRRLPSSWRNSSPATSYGEFLHAVVRLRSPRNQFHGTFFFRNRPELELIRSLADRRPLNSPLKLTVLACSNGAEVYSILWAIRSVRPDLKLEVHAVDISREILEVARNGVYSGERTSLVNERIMERLTDEEVATIFDCEGDNKFRIKSWISQGVQWLAGDAGDPALAESLGPADIVVANRFLCHMKPPQAEKCLRNLPHFVTPGGYLFVSGIDLDVRTKVAVDLKWVPIPDHMEEIHDGDSSVRRDWPWQYWGLEPFDSKRPGWQNRYAAVFRLGSQGESRVAEATFDSSPAERV